MKLGKPAYADPKVFSQYSTEGIWDQAAPELHGIQIYMNFKYVVTTIRSAWSHIPSVEQNKSIIFPSKTDQMFMDSTVLYVRYPAKKLDP